MWTYVDTKRVNTSKYIGPDTLQAPHLVCKIPLLTFVMEALPYDLALDSC